MDADGAIHRECTVPAEPEAIASVFHDARDRIARIGLEAGPLSQWLSDGLAPLGFEVVLMETRQVRAALSAMVVKTDRTDARGIAQLLRAGWFRPVHVKTADAREQRALLSARSTLVVRLRDIENSLRGLLRGFGLRIPRSLGQRWEATARDCLEGHAALLAIFEPLLAARRALQEQLALLDGRVREMGTTSGHDARQGLVVDEGLGHRRRPPPWSTTRISVCRQTDAASVSGVAPRSRMHPDRSATIYSG